MEFPFPRQEGGREDVLDEITDWIKTYQDVADWIVGLDVSGHASMPWACVKFFVEVRKVPIIPR